jgi:apolipoprotein N-acyltransferase
MAALAALAGAGGLLAALGQAPWGLWALAIAGYGLIAASVAQAESARRGFALGWLAGLAQFALALNWIVEPFFVEADRHAWMAPFALALLPGGLALFWGAAAALALRLARTGPGRAWALVPALTAAEALRGHLFGGLPWAMPGHIWIETPVAQAAALGGALGLTLLTLAAAAALAALALAPGARAAAALAGLVGLLGALWLGGAAVLARPMPAGPGLRLRLVQPDAAQHLKWDPAWAGVFFDRHLALTAAPAEDGRAPELVLWSETAVPFLLEAPGAGLVQAAQAAGGAPVVLGIQRRSVGADGVVRYFNSLAVIDPTGEPVAIYDKHHLVPFGEYIPWLGPLADRPGWEWLAAFTGSALFGYTPGPGPAVLDLSGLVPAAGRVLPLICYEAVFPRHLRTPERPDWLMQLTNDAWFGVHSGPFQHLALARLRAIEQGLPLVRVANTGVSAVIDARGRVLAGMGLGQAGVVDADLPAALPATAYARTGDLPWHLGLALALAGLVLRRRLTVR